MMKTTKFQKCLLATVVSLSSLTSFAVDQYGNETQAEFEQRMSGLHKMSNEEMSNVNMPNTLMIAGAEIVTADGQKIQVTPEMQSKIAEVMFSQSEQDRSMLMHMQQMQEAMSTYNDRVVIPMAFVDRAIDDSIARQQQPGLDLAAQMRQNVAANSNNPNQAVTLNLNLGLLAVGNYLAGHSGENLTFNNTVKCGNLCFYNEPRTIHISPEQRTQINSLLGGNTQINGLNVGNVVITIQGHK